MVELPHSFGTQHIISMDLVIMEPMCDFVDVDDNNCYVCGAKSTEHLREAAGTNVPSGSDVESGSPPSLSAKAFALHASGRTVRLPRPLDAA